MKSKWIVRILAIILAIAMIAGSAFYLIYVISPASLYTYAMDEQDIARLDALKLAIEQLELNYKDEVDVNKLIDDAYSAVFQNFDRWTTYYASNEEKDAFVDQLANSTYAGVGVTISVIDQRCYVTAVNASGPAFSAGIKPGDIIKTVGIKDVKGLTVDQVSNRLRGKEGSTVNIVVDRNGEELKFKVPRKTLSINNVYFRIYDPCAAAEIEYVNDLNDRTDLVGYISISEFDEGTASHFLLTKTMLEAAGISKFIIDLRDNPGGYMNEALVCAESFLKNGDPMIYYIQQGKTVETIKSENYLAGKAKTIVLVNENSASASEAFAAVMQGSKAAKLVGKTTYGKGVAQEIFDLGNGSYVKMSTCYFVGPNKKAIDGVGVKPDYDIDSLDGRTTYELLTMQRDFQFDKALELLK